jgi:hypothetical protein
MPKRTLLLLLLLAACGGGDRPPGASDTDAAVSDAAPPPDGAAPASAPAPGPDQSSAPLTPDDIGRWEKGLQGELEAVQAAAAKMKAARTGEDTLNAMMGVQEMEGMDTTKMPEDMRAEFRIMRENQLKQLSAMVPEDVQQALQPRALELRKKTSRWPRHGLRGAGM